MSRSNRIVLYAATVAHLRPAQLAHRLRLRAQRVAARHLPESVWQARVPVQPPGWPSGYTPVDAKLARGYPTPEDNALGLFRFLEEDRCLGTPADWHQPAATQLWRYHLHYFEWAWSFVAHGDRSWARREFASLWRSWRSAARIGRGDAWSPYVVSLRAWALCGVFDALIRNSPIEHEVVSDLARHARFLRMHVERDVGGNHLVKNLKALVGLGVFLGDRRLVEAGRGELARQLPVQVLADGGHYERSPSYHCQVLADLLDVAALLTAAGAEHVPGIVEAIEAMRSWLGTMLLPDGDVPLFNDCTRVGTARVEALEPVSPSGPVAVLQTSGYVVVRSDRLHLVADVGPPCPPDLPAHAHADCLSFELAVDGERFVVDTGTSTYAPGPRRAFERSTAAHNTAEIDRADQSEVWGVFRAARLARPRLERIATDNDSVEFTASHDGYRRLRGRPVHRRTWNVSADTLRIRDEIDGRGRHEVTARLHLRPGVEAVRMDAGSVMVGVMTLSVSGAALALQPAELADDFGRREPALAVTATATGKLPCTLETALSATGPAPSPPSTIDAPITKGTA